VTDSTDLHGLYLHLFSHQRLCKDVMLGERWIKEGEEIGVISS
jgi:hypothetical protein